MSASRPFQGDRRGGRVSSHRGGRSEGWGRKSAPLGGVSRLRSKVTKSSAIPLPPARFFASAHGGPPCSAAFVPAAPREVEKLRVFRLRPQFFRCSPALFSFGGRVAPSAGVKCAVPRVRVSRTRQPLFVFSLHRFTHPAQRTDYLHIAGENFAFSPSPRSSLPHGGRCRGRQAQRARSEIGQFLLMHR